MDIQQDWFWAGGEQQKEIPTESPQIPSVCTLPSDSLHEAQPAVSLTAYMPGAGGGK